MPVRRDFGEEFLDDLETKLRVRHFASAEFQHDFDLHVLAEKINRVHHLDTEVVRINARKLETTLADDAAVELARRSRGTPRVANGRLYWARSFAHSEADGKITLDVARAALDMAQIDREGLDKQDRQYLETLIGVFQGGPTGAEALAATMNIATDTLSDEVEPYLLREQFIVRTPRGRVATPKSFSLLGREMPKKSDDESTLF